jgi:hypothetical protein
VCFCVHAGGGWPNFSSRCMQRQGLRIVLHPYAIQKRQFQLGYPRGVNDADFVYV